ncbi:MAG: hypothetical protein J0I77_02630 [Rudaea sp.]|uniref:hypothetical protein n=1 Tax=unclassified Rudaea TaxID=2627037 RepID=UPI0010F9DFE2|nr:MULTISPECIES: hypothetical protein [unclassified Rudaea]MBN8884594.1 hypothetical protein [Rudaea sp.]
MMETLDSNNEIVLDRLRETLDDSIPEPYYSLASMMTKADRNPNLFSYAREQIRRTKRPEHEGGRM